MIADWEDSGKLAVQKSQATEFPRQLSQLHDSNFR